MATSTPRTPQDRHGLTRRTWRGSGRRPRPGVGGAGQFGHPGHFRPLLPIEQVDAAVVVAPDHCRHCRAPCPSTKARRPSRPWRHQVVALLTGRYRLSRREVRQERAQSTALAPVVAEARTAVQQVAVVNVDETGWRQGQQRTWLWTAVTAGLTGFLIDRTRGVWR